MLKLLDITKEYKVDEESVLALHGVEIEFRKSEFVSILGPSGCGKTTLLNIIGGLDKYTSGDIQIEGISTKQYDDVDWDTYRNRRIGFVFQSYNLIPHLTVIKNVSMSLILAGVSKDEAKERGMEALRKVGMENQARKKPNQLSGGQMQRVAIARSLVNNPEIILADEPTGALDSESGIQVMDLLKVVAEDRLVIMVTHNPLLAEQYSTRIVYLKDGAVVDDTMPYDSSAERASATKIDANKATAKLNASNISDESDEADADGALVGDTATDIAATYTEAGNNKQKKKGCVCKPIKQTRFQLYQRKVHEQDKSSMKIATAVSLSFTNLLSKKGRTLLTSIAGSIGIIGIILVLCLSSGIGGYVAKLEQDALSQYPIQINEKNVDISSLLKMLTPGDSKEGNYPTDGIVRTQEMLSKLFKDGNLDLLSGTNDLATLKKYLDANLNEKDGQAKYDYGTVFNVYSKNLADQKEYAKVHPFVDAAKGMFKGDGSSEAPPIDFSAFEDYAYMLDAWDELSSSEALLDQQYEVLDGEWATEANEIVIVLDKKNQINDYALFMLGLLSPDDFGDILSGNLGSKTFTIKDLLHLKYLAFPNSTYLQKNLDGKGYKLPDSADRCNGDVGYINSIVNTPEGVLDINKAKELKVVGVVRPKPDAIVTSINSVVAYTHALTEEMIDISAKNGAVKAFQDEVEKKNNGDPTKIQNLFSPFAMTYANPKPEGDNKTKEVRVGDAIENIADVTEMLRELGVVDLAHPKSIRIYCSTFDAKEKIVALFDRYAKSEGGSRVHYTDYLEMMMGYVNTLASTVTGALIGFSSISLIVSTIMIAIIIYTSVLERRKEIGVLRSLGARKKDVSRVFIAESAMIGAYSGVIGLIFSAILSVIGNVILEYIFKIPNLMTITWWHCLMMLSISIFLSMFAGFIPSRVASKKDPAIALRSE